MKLSRAITKAILLPLVFACAVALNLNPKAAAHTFHTSLMRLEYNRQEQLVEISIQVFAHDLETVLSKRAGKNIRLDKSPDAAARTLAYLQDAFTLKNRDNQTKTLAWVGMETKADAVMLYVETKMPEGLSGAQVRDQIFFDLLQDQINLINVRYDGKHTDLVFKPGDGFKPLAEAARDK
ncbi:MAG: DUF6702 family protein [Pyrinomonadaceae bacterium]